jgi:hypothetical protein
MNSFLNGKKSLAIAPLQRTATGAAPRPATKSGVGHAHNAGSAHANVEVVKEGDKVVRLVVTCVCGERVEIECLYPAGS